MESWYNSSEKPLSSSGWLLDHHIAKTYERTKFAKKVNESYPKSILDLGCGPGLWFEILNQVCDPDVKFHGADIDRESLKQFAIKAKTWDRRVETYEVNLEYDISALPKVDVILAFNVFSYLNNPSEFLEKLKNNLLPGGKIFIRQYDGSLLRIGPMSQELRSKIDNSLLSSLMSSGQFQHYNLDSVYQIIQASSYTEKKLDFELYKRSTPYPKEFVSYYNNTLEWSKKYLSPRMKSQLSDWIKKHNLENGASSYFFEVDLVATMS